MLMCADINDFYYNTPIVDFEYTTPPPPNNITPRNSITVKPEGPSCHRRLHLNENNEGNYRTQTGREAIQQPPDQKPGHEWICTSKAHTLTLAPPHVLPRVSLVIDVLESSKHKKKTCTICSNTSGKNTRSPMTGRERNS